MRYGRLSFHDLASVRRIVIAVVACQLVGGIIGVAYGYHHFWFKNFWAGGVFAMPLGFVLGAVWHFSRTEDRRESTRIAAIVGAIGAVVFVMAIVFVIPQMRSETRNLARIAQLPEEAIRRIEVFERYGKVEILTITDPSIIAAFSRSISDAAGHSPNHPRYTRSWHLVASGPVRHHFELHLDPEFPDSVIGYFVMTTESSMSYQGSFKSLALRRWVEEQLMQANVSN